MDERMKGWKNEWMNEWMNEWRELVNLKRPLLRVPNLCIHLQSSEERSSFTVNKENHLQPILAMVESTLNQVNIIKENHFPPILAMVESTLNQVNIIKENHLQPILAMVESTLNQAYHQGEPSPTNPSHGVGGVNT